MKIKALAVAAALTLASLPTMAATVTGCGNGNDDNTCLKQASISGPTSCSTAAGWTQTAPAQVVNGAWTAPVCNYTAPPTCPPGTTQATAPTWTGTSWVGLSCTENPPQQSNPFQAGMQQCLTDASYFLSLGSNDQYIYPMEGAQCDPSAAQTQYGDICQFSASAYQTTVTTNQHNGNTSVSPGYPTFYMYEIQMAVGNPANNDFACDFDASGNLIQMWTYLDSETLCGSGYTLGSDYAPGEYSQFCYPN